MKRFSSSVWRFARWILFVFLAVICVFACILLFVLSQFRGTAFFPVDCAVVFGAAVQPQYGSGGHIVGSQAGPGIARRVGTVVDLYRQGLVKKVFLTGGKGEGMRQSEAVVMRSLAARGGVPLRDIVIEDQSRSTAENIAFTKPLTGSCASIVAVSDRYHLARIEFLAWRSGWRVSTFPSEWHATRAFEIYSVLREVGAFFFAFAAPRAF